MPYIRGMAKTPESKVKRKVAEILIHYDAYYFSPPANGFGRSGIPDIIACYRGQFIAIECKAGKNTTTALQRKELSRIEIAGGYSLVINESNIDQLVEVLEQIGKRPAW
jgi:Holliday junction resolvase